MDVSLKNAIIWFALIGRVFQIKSIPIKLPGKGTGQKLLTTIDILYDVDVGSCARECLLRRKCLGIEYVLATGRCSLYSEDWTNDTTLRFLDLPDIRMWPQEMVGTCASRPCPETMKCIPLPEKFTCIQVQNCAHIKRCKPTYPDGLYWVFSGNTTKVANCTSMDYDTPTTTLISGSAENGGFRAVMWNALRFSGASVKNIQEREIEQRFGDRRMHVQRFCQRISVPSQTSCHINGVKNHLYPIDAYNMTFCAIEKAGSTFFKRIIKVLNSAPGKRSNPFDISKGHVYSSQVTLRNLTSDGVRQRMESNKNVIFVRDPFTRAFSGYLDKLFSPNTYFWKSLGKKIVETFRPCPTSVQCGYDVTFPEFISALLKALKEDKCFEPHFSSSYSHCFPCNYTYTYIGKYETLQEDVYHILDKEGMLSSINLTNLQESNDKDAIVDGTKFAFGGRNAIEACMPFIRGLKRFWKRLQCRGMLDKRANFPFTEADEQNITLKYFKESVLHAYYEFDPKDRLMNRQEAMSEAFRSLNESLAKELNEVFYLDFELFGYPSTPDLSEQTDFKYLTLE